MFFYPFRTDFDFILNLECKKQMLSKFTWKSTILIHGHSEISPPSLHPSLLRMLITPSIERHVDDILVQLKHVSPGGSKKLILSNVEVKCRNFLIYTQT